MKFPPDGHPYFPAPYEEQTPLTDAERADMRPGTIVAVIAYLLFTLAVIASFVAESYQP